jgi:hypothetical protein
MPGRTLAADPFFLDTRRGADSTIAPALDGNIKLLELKPESVMARDGERAGSLSEPGLAQGASLDKCRRGQRASIDKRCGKGNVGSADADKAAYG